MNEKTLKKHKLVYGLVESICDLYEEAKDEKDPEKKEPEKEEQVNEWRDGNTKKIWCVEAAYDDENGDGYDALIFIRADTIEEAEKFFKADFIEHPEGDGWTTKGQWKLVGINETTEEFMNEVEKEYQKTYPHPHYTAKIEDLNGGLEGVRFDAIYATDDDGKYIPDFGKGSLDADESKEPEKKEDEEPVEESKEENPDEEDKEDNE
jgi:hypothetical protein